MMMPVEPLDDASASPIASLPPRSSSPSASSSTPKAAVAEADRSLDFEDTRGSLNDSATDIESTEGSDVSVVVVGPEVKKMTPADALRWAIADLAACGADVLDKAMEEAMENVGTRPKKKTFIQADESISQGLQDSKLATFMEEPKEPPIILETEVGKVPPKEKIMKLPSPLPMPEVHSPVLEVQPSVPVVPKPVLPVSVVRPIKQTTLVFQGGAGKRTGLACNLSKRQMLAGLGALVGLIVITILVWLVVKSQEQPPLNSPSTPSTQGQPLRWRDLMRMVAAEKTTPKPSVLPPS